MTFEVKVDKIPRVKSKRISFSEYADMTAARDNSFNFRARFPVPDKSLDRFITGSF